MDWFWRRMKWRCPQIASFVSSRRRTAAHGACVVALQQAAVTGWWSRSLLCSRQPSLQANVNPASSGIQVSGNRLISRWSKASPR